MLVSCSYCNGLHERGKRCQNKPTNNSRKKEETYISRFRSSNSWKKKREEIKARDKFLCQVCLLDKKYIFQKLEVHHIDPISEKWNKRLENGNLITLCVHCHKRAELGEIGKRLLFKIAENNAYTF